MIIKRAKYRSRNRVVEKKFFFSNKLKRGWMLSFFFIVGRAQFKISQRAKESERLSEMLDTHTRRARIHNESVRCKREKEKRRKGETEP